MNQNRRETFLTRAALFASPVDSSTMPKKKVARKEPIPTLVFPDESRQHVEDAGAAPIVNEIISDEELDDVEPMEVDTSVVPSPGRAVAPENVSCDHAATPRRKSMPTPGKRLCFTSKEMVVSDEKKSDDTTHLELLMANNPEDMPGLLKASIMDKQAMEKYLKEVKKEIEDYKTIKKNRKTLLEKAEHFVEDGTLLSTLPPESCLMDMTVRREQTHDEIVKKLYANFAKNTQVAGEQTLAEKKAAAAKKTNLSLKNTMSRLEDVQKEYEKFQVEMCEKYEKERVGMQKIEVGMERMDELVGRMRPLNFF
ncbi:unnamed protein product [Caenorhabditis sp. 36 PRJEB53466]|nr:unnamed protein product [Caenorhabditis sp. 36 PRJEB53466]